MVPAPPESSNTKVARLLWQEVERQRARCDRLVGGLKLEVAKAAQEASGHWASALEYRREARQLSRKVQDSTLANECLESCNLRLMDALLELQRDRELQAQEVSWLLEEVMCNGATLLQLQQDCDRAEAAEAARFATVDSQDRRSGCQEGSKYKDISAALDAAAYHSNEASISILASAGSKPCMVRNLCHILG